MRKRKKKEVTHHVELRRWHATRKQSRRLRRPRVPFISDSEIARGFELLRPAIVTAPEPADWVIDFQGHFCLWLVYFVWVYTLIFFTFLIDFIWLVIYGLQGTRCISFYAHTRV